MIRIRENSAGKKVRKWNPTADSSVTVAEEGGVRSLHIGGLAIQSAMRVEAPDELELHYTRAMMGFLLFNARPRDVLMVGLGGGSIAKFIHQRMSQTRLTVVEIRREVVAAARGFFSLPRDDERLKVIIDDGARYIPANPLCADVMLLDAFDNGRHPSSLCSQAFYDAAHEAVRPDGILAVNFMAFDRKLDALRSRLERSFDGRVLLLEAADRVNVIALAFRGGPRRIAIKELRGRAAALKEVFRLPFDRMVTSIVERNRHTGRHIIVLPEAMPTQRP
jgi:spermidine synthase